MSESKEHGTATPARARRARLAPRRRQSVREMELLLRLSRQISTIDALDELLPTIVDLCAQETDSERGTLFLSDQETGELYSHVAQGLGIPEIRIMNTTGVAGHVYTTGQGIIIDNAYSNPLFDRAIDEETQYVTRNLACVPIRFKGEMLGVLQMLNKRSGAYTKEDLRLLEAMAEQTALTLRSVLFRENTKALREQEMKFLSFVTELTSDFDLSTVLTKIVTEAAAMLKAERATLFLHDEKRKELFSRVAMGHSVDEIRIPNHVGIAGAVFTSGEAINLPYAYADLRFNPAQDKRTGYFTRSILCVPIVKKEGKIIGVTQALNKKGGPFTKEDEARLKAFTARLAISLENAKLFEDVQHMKNYNESMLHSMSTGVVTLNEEGGIATCNAAGLAILKVQPPEILNQPAHEFFSGPNAWVEERIQAVNQTLRSDIRMDAEMTVAGERISVNLTVLPLMAEDESTGKQKHLGSLLMIEDISTEKRMKSTMSRYMDPGIADQLLAGGDEVLGGKSVEATVLFSDIRGFTSISEELGPQPTVALLNEYFTIMVECVQKQGGMLDKFIGDAIMAVFGLPVRHEDDGDRAVRSAVSMISELRRWNQQRAAAGKVPLDMGIGINTDRVVSGNIGSPKRMDYTIIGDGVNLASRLESACKQYASHILITENTLHHLRGTYRMREVDRVVVKGKREPVPIYEILDYHTEETFPHLMDAVNAFKSGLAYYRSRQWDKAIDGFAEASFLNSEDQLPRIYVDRCMHFKLEPPPENWNGEWIMKTK
jgi:adenylate cyclase